MDANVFSEVLNKDPKSSFQPVSEWIYSGLGKFVIGGAKYKKEIGFNKHEKTIKQLKLLKDIGKLVLITDNKVDEEETNFKSKLDKGCDDHHVIALLKVSGCKLIATGDKRSFPYIQKNTKAKIYSSENNSDLLTSRNIAKCCKPAKKSK
ncbi:MAG: hypothetical protein ACKO3R_01690 [bacterium]